MEPGIGSWTGLKEMESRYSNGVGRSGVDWEVNWRDWGGEFVSVRVGGGGQEIWRAVGSQRDTLDLKFVGHHELFNCILLF